MAGKFFFIRSKMNGLVLDIQGGDTDPGTKVFMWDQKDENDADNQLFYFDRPNKCIRTKLNDFCIEVDDDNTLVINPFDDDNDNQKWVVGDDRIFNHRNPDRVLDVAQGEDDERARVCAWDWHGEDNQLWETENVRAFYFFIQSELNDMVLDIQGADDSPGTKAIMWPKGDGEDNQLWYEDRMGIIHSKMNDFVLDSSQGDSIEMHPFEPGNDSQKWERIGRVIMNQEDRNVLDIKKADEDRGAELCAWEFNGDSNQLWKVDYYVD